MSDFPIRLDNNGLQFSLPHLNDDHSLFSAVCVRLFTDQRADDSIIDDGTSKRGWWGDAFMDNKKRVGSLLWVLQRQKINNETLRRIEDYASDALQDFITRKIASDISITATANIETVELHIIITKPSGEKQEFAFAWQETTKENTS